MTRLLLLVCACSLLTACGDAGRDDTAPIDTANELKAYTAKAGAPLMTEGAYAPWAKMKGDALPGVHPEDAPRTDEIDIPLYPGSYIVRSGKLGEFENSLRFVTLICEDSYEAVILFFQDRLIGDRDWTFDDQYNVFQPGKGNDFILQNTPFVSVMDINPESSEMQDVDAEFLSHFRTRIQVTYQKKN